MSDHIIEADSYLTGAHAELLNHYFPEGERELAMRIVEGVLSRLPVDNSPGFGPSVAKEMRQLYIMLRQNLKDRPLLDPVVGPEGEPGSIELEYIFLAEGLTLLALENRRLLPEHHPQSVQ